MACAEKVVLRFGNFGKSRNAAESSEAVEVFASVCQHFVGVGLMSDIPDYFILRQIENFEQRDCEFDCSERGSEVTASFRDRFDHLFPRFGGNFLEFRQTGVFYPFNHSCLLRSCSLSGSGRVQGRK